MALLNIHVKLEGEADDSFKYSPYMSRISYGLPSTSPLYFLPWVKITREKLVALAKELGLNSDDNFSLARMFLVPRYLAKMLDTFPRPATSNAAEKRSVIVSNIRTLLSLIFPAGAPLYISNRIFTIENQTWNGEYKEKDRRTPTPRSKTPASSKTRKVSFKSPITSSATTRSRAKTGGAKGAEAAPFVYNIDVTLSVTLGRRPAPFSRRLRASCQTRRKSLRKAILDVFPNTDIGLGKSPTKHRPSSAPIMYSSTGYKLRAPYTRQSQPYHHPYTHSRSPYTHSGFYGSPYAHSGFYGSPYMHSSGPYTHSGSPYTHSGSPYMHSSSPYSSFRPPTSSLLSPSTLAERARHAGVAT